jgi:hypothetical protein
MDPKDKKDEIWLYPPSVTPTKDDPIHVKGQWAFTVDVQEAEAFAAAKASKTTKAPPPTSPSTTPTTSPSAITIRWPPPIDEQKVAARGTSSCRHERSGEIGYNTYQGLSTKKTCHLSTVQGAILASQQKASWLPPRRRKRVVMIMSDHHHRHHRFVIWNDNVDNKIL